MRTYIVWVIIILLFLPVYADSSDQNIKIKKSEVIGRWVKNDAYTTECFCGECLDIQFDRDNDMFCVESNQIYVKASYILDMENQVVRIFFKNATDIGMGGATLPWETFDRTKPLATIDISKAKQGRISLKWTGFKNTIVPAKTYPFGESYTGTYGKLLPSRN